MSCGKCGLPVGGDKTIALGRDWHPDCFRCGTCGDRLPGEFFQKDGTPYCRRDYFNAFLMKCASCGQPIEGREIVDKGQHFHEACFVCAGCRKPCDKGYFTKNGAKYCPHCNIDENVGKQGERDALGHCSICYKHLNAGEPFLTVASQRYHTGCFKCEFCKRPIPGHEHYHTEEVSSKLTKACCDSCYNSGRAEVCGGCGGVLLSGTSTSALGKRFHLQCFKCASCQRVMPKGELFVVDSGNALCNSCGQHV